jgi:nicotinamide-nucleotide amidase
VPDQIWPLLGELSRLLLNQRAQMTCAESCTGGLIAACCTALPGSSDWFERGFVTYSNAAKTADLGVPPDWLEQHGAVSEPVALAMARGAQQRAGVQCALAVTGVAGPSGGSADKPVGTVWLAWCVGERTWAERALFAGDRASVRAATVARALEGLTAALREPQDRLSKLG